MDFSTSKLVAITSLILFLYVGQDTSKDYPSADRALAGWYDAYHAYKKDRHLHQWKCHEIYGPVVRYTPNGVLINTSEALKDIYAGSRNSNVRKAPHYRFLHDPAMSTHSAIDKSIHGRKRRLLSHAFSDQALKALDSYMVTNINTWLSMLGEGKREEKSAGWSEPRNMSQWANYVTFDVLGDLCFGKPFGLLTDATTRFIPHLMLSRTAAFNVVSNSPLLPFWHLFRRYGIERAIMPKIVADSEKFKAFAGKAVQERLAQAKREEEMADADVRKDFFYWLTGAKDPETGEGYSMAEFWAEARLLITAGSDTSSITTAAAFFYLARRPHVLSKLQSELRSTFASMDEIVSGPKLSSCQYLRAVIDETLRIAPPVPSSLPREVCNGGMAIGGDFFPEGTIVGTSAYAIHHNEDYFEEPWSYKPERWIANEKEGATDESIRRARTAFCPFSLGSRGCVGKSMAYAELSIALGRVFYQYDIKLTDGDTTGAGDPKLAWGRRRRNEFQLEDVFVSARDGPNIAFKAHA